MSSVIKSNTAPTQVRHKKPKFTRERLAELVARGQSQDEIAKELGTYRTYVCRLLRRYGIPYVARPNAPHNPLRMYAILHEERVVKGKTVAQIAADLQLSPSQVYYRLRRLHLTGPQVLDSDLHQALVGVHKRLTQAIVALDGELDRQARDTLRANLHYASTLIAQAIQGYNKASSPEKPADGAVRSD